MELRWTGDPPVAGRLGRNPRTRNPRSEAVRRRLAEDFKAVEAISAKADLIPFIT
jgi:hypothetical protein